MFPIIERSFFQPRESHQCWNVSRVSASGLINVNELVRAEGLEPTRSTRRLAESDFSQCLCGFAAYRPF